MDKFGRSIPSLHKKARIVQAPNAIAFTADGDYNLRDHKLCNVKPPTEDSDAVNKKYLDDALSAVNEFYHNTSRFNKQLFDKVRVITGELKMLSNVLDQNKQAISKFRDEFFSYAKHNDDSVAQINKQLSDKISRSDCLKEIETYVNNFMLQTLNPILDSLEKNLKDYTNMVQISVDSLSERINEKADKKV